MILNFRSSCLPLLSDGRSFFSLCGALGGHCAAARGPCLPQTAHQVARRRHAHPRTTPALGLTIGPCNALVNHGDLGPADRWLRGLPLTWRQVLAPCQMPVFSSSLFASLDAEMQQERAPTLSFCSVSKALSPATSRQRPRERGAEALHTLKKLRSRERRGRPRWRGVGPQSQTPNQSE